jgi:gluconolactonase
MEAKTVAPPAPATSLPGPPELIPGRPDAVVDLQTDAGAGLVGAVWRYSNARVTEIDFVELGSPDDPLGPGTVPNRTYDVLPHAEAPDYDDSSWSVLRPEETLRRLANGRVCFNWYRVSLTLPDRIGDTDVDGATVVFEVVIDDYAEVWVNGELPHALGDRGGPVVGGFNAPNRVILTRDARPGETFTVAVFGINGPLSASPPNYIWMRTATLELYEAGRTPLAFEAPLAFEGDLYQDARLEQVAGGFEFTEGPLWSPEGALLFSSPNTNVIYRWSPHTGTVTLFRSKSGYAGVDVGRFAQPGSNGLTFDPDGRLAICQHGNRRIIRVNPHGDITVLADRYQGRRLNSRTTSSTAPTEPSTSPTRRSGCRRASTTRRRSCRSAACSGYATARPCCSPTSCPAPTGSPSHRTSGTSMSGTGTPTTRWSCDTRSTRTATCPTARCSST